MKRLVPALLTAAVLAILTAFLLENREHIARSWSLSPGLFAAVAGLTLATLFVRAVANRLHFRSLGVDTGTGDWFRLVVVTAFTNYLPLSAGLVAKAVFLKRVHDMPFRRFAVGQTTLLVVIMATNGAVGLGLVAWVFREHLVGVVGLGFAVMLAAGLLLLLPPRVLETLSPSWLSSAVNAGVEARGSWPVVALCQMAMLALSAFGLLLCFEMGEARVGFAACAIFTAAAVLTRFVTIVPGALGVREFLIGGLAVLTGFDLRDAVVASTLARAAEMLVVFALGGVFSFTLSGDLAERAES